MPDQVFTTHLYLPSQAATETEATIVGWHVSEGDSFEKGQSLAEVESAKATFEFEAPCSGVMVKRLFTDGQTAQFEDPIVEITTSDASMKQAIKPSAAAAGESEPEMSVPRVDPEPVADPDAVYMLGVGTYLPERIVRNEELLKDFPDMSDEYLFGVTGIRERHWAAAGQKPSDMAYAAACQAIETSNIPASEINAIIVATTTPDVVMPSTACILQNKLELWGVPSFDLNAACSGWLYGLGIAKGLVSSGVADTILVVGVDQQSQLLDKTDKGTAFLFGDGAGATIVSSKHKGHVIKKEILIADARGLHQARREQCGFTIAGAALPAGSKPQDPYVRLDGHALFRFATGSFAAVINDIIVKSGWEASDVRWVVPHQANGRILKAVSRKIGIPFERVLINIDHVGNTSSASIPLALAEIERGLQKHDKLVFCSVGAGVTAAAISIEW